MCSFAAVDHNRNRRFTFTGDTIFELKDGTTRRVSIIPDHRVMYVIDAGHSQKIGLNDIRAVDFSVDAQ
jgi:hypothetical protein